MPEIPPNSLFSILSFISFLLSGFSLPWHMQSWNMGICMYMTWTSLGCLILFTNSIVWNDDTINRAPLWCDISARYIVGASVGIPASSFCIIHRLHHITKLRMVPAEKKEVRRLILTDLSIGIGFPCIVMILQCVVQTKRFAIIEQIGCYPVIANTLASYFIIWMWPLVIGLVSLVYAILTFRRVLRQKQQLKRMLDAGFSISAGRYWRLMALCTSEIVFTVPLSLCTIILNLTTDPPIPYESWAAVHADDSQIIQLPTAIWRTSIAIPVEMTRWLYILCAFVIFAFFGWAEEIRYSCHSVFWSICHHFGHSNPSDTSLNDTVLKRKQTFTGAEKTTHIVNGVNRQSLFPFEVAPPSTPLSRSLEEGLAEVTL